MKTQPIDHYIPSPLRESNPRKSTAEIQRDIELMRAAYADRMNANQYRRDNMVGWSLLTVAIGIIAFVVLITLFW